MWLCGYTSRVFDGKLASPSPDAYVHPRYSDIGCVASVANSLLSSAVLVMAVRNAFVMTVNCPYLVVDRVIFYFKNYVQYSCASQCH
jgi:hypothetical protein